MEGLSVFIFACLFVCLFLFPPAGTIPEHGAAQPAVSAAISMLVICRVQRGEVGVGGGDE